MTTALGLRGSIRRCPACGHRVEQPSPPVCPLCAMDFGDNRVTGADISPYAQLYAHGQRGWRTMSEWIWFSGSERLKHLALMRSSAASVRFARTNLALLVLGCGLIQAVTVGWHQVSASAALKEAGESEPSGQGWLPVASAPRPLPPGQPAEVPVDLWWNPTQSAAAVFFGVLVAALLLWVGMSLLTWGIRRAHLPTYRDEQRMTAALHYSTAWAIPIFVAALVAGLRPLSFIGSIAGWSWYPPDSGFILSAAVVAGFGGAMWWFWLIRLGFTAPARTRSRVVAFLSVGGALIVSGMTAVWWWGLAQLYPHLFSLMRIAFHPGVS